jgi:cardiolipin synthase
VNGWRKLVPSKSVAVSLLGKIKTFAQMLAIPLLLYYFPFAGIDTRQLGHSSDLGSALLTLWSMGYYLRMAWPEIAKRSADK